MWVCEGGISFEVPNINSRYLTYPENSLSLLGRLYLGQEAHEPEDGDGSPAENHEESAKPPRGMCPGNHRNRRRARRKADDVTGTQRPTSPFAVGDPADQHVVNRDLAKYHQHESNADDDRRHAAGADQHQCKQALTCSHDEKDEL